MPGLKVGIVISVIDKATNPLGACPDRRGSPLPSDIMATRQVPPISALLLWHEGHFLQLWHRETSFLDTMAAIYERVAKGPPDDTNRVPGPEGGR